MNVENLYRFPALTDAELEEEANSPPASPPSFKRPKPRPQKHRWFDPWLLPAGPLLEISVGLIDHLAGIEARTAGYERKRSRRPNDLTNFEHIVRGCVANLAMAVLDPPVTGKLAVHGGNINRKRTRYDRLAFVGKQFPRVMNLFEEAGYSTFLPPKVIRGEASSLSPTDQFASLVEEHGVGFEHFGRHPGEEVLVLTRRSASEDRNRWVDYDDTDQTNSLREQVLRFNRFLAGADIKFLDDGLGPVNALSRTSIRTFFVDECDPIAFDKGGRLFGGFWVNLKSHRRSGIRINGEPIVDLDFKSMFCRLAYAEVGAVPTPGDLYAIEGLDGYRSGVKLAVNTLFWDNYTGRRKWPDEMGIGVGSDEEARRDPSSPAAEFDALLPAGWGRPKRLQAALIAKHPALEKAFGSGIGGTLMFRESTIMVTLLDDLMRLGVVALPLHDGISVAGSKAEVARRVMEDVAHRVTGLEFPVEVEA